MSAGGDTEINGFRGVGDGHLVELGELGAGSREADLQAFELSEPSFAAGFVDPGDQVVADVDESVALGGVGSEQWATQECSWMQAVA